MKILKWFNGKKTVIGAALILAAMFIEEVVIGIWGYNPEWIYKALETIQWIGGPLTTIGLGHKAGKALTSLKTKKDGNP